MSHLLQTTEVGLPNVQTDRPAYPLYPQLRQQIERDLGEAESRYLAEPVFDAHSAKIDWYSQGSVPPRPYSALTQAEQIQLIGQIEATRQRLLALAAQYLASGDDPSHRALGYALQAASGIPAAEYRYQVGDQPLVVFWGFQQEAPDYASQLAQYIKLNTPPPVPEPKLVQITPPVEKAPHKPVKNEAPSTRPEPPPFSPPAPKKRTPWGCLAGTLLLLLLLALLLSLLSKLMTPSPEEAPPPSESAAEPKPAPKPEPDAIEQVMKSCDIAKLAGDWQSYSNQLTNARSGEPILVNYRFEEAGLGEVEVIQVDQSRCIGKAKAEFKEVTMENKTDGCVLHIQATSAACPQAQGSYSEHQVECQLNASGEAECTIIQQSTEPIHAVFERLRAR